MPNMFTAQPAAAPQPTGTAPATGKPTGFFSAGNAFGQIAGQAYQNTQNYLQNNPLNYNAAPALPGANDFSGDRQRIEQALMGRARGELDTRYGQETADFEQTMANQGIDIGSERYQRERALFDKARNEAYNDANFRAMIAGGDEQSRLFGLGLQARQQSVAETDAMHTSRLADMAALLEPAMKMEGLINERTIADNNNATTRYGIDTVSNTANLDRASRDEIARRSDDTTRYGINSVANTATADRTSRDQNARRSDATDRLGIRTGARTSDKDRRSRENEGNKNRTWESGEKKKDRDLTTSEGDKNRKNSRRLGGNVNIGITPEDDLHNKPPFGSQ